MSEERESKIARIDGDHGDLNDFKQALLSTLECSLCLSLICEPISIPCGHSFCRVCLVKSLRRHKKKCPSCREICHVHAENVGENIMLKNLALSVDSTLYQQRLEENEQEKTTWRKIYPIFYYNSTMFPGNKLNLHLFEPRYKLMMQRVVNSNRAFAYVPNFNNYHAREGDISLTAELKDVEFLADGRCLLEAVISKRQRIIDQYVEEGTQGLHFCRVEEYNDHPINEADINELVRLYQDAKVVVDHLTSEARSRLMMEHRYGSAPTVNIMNSSTAMDTTTNENNENTGSNYLINHKEIETFSLWFTGISALSENAKMQLLLSQNTLERMQRSVHSFDSVLRRINGGTDTGSTSASNGLRSGAEALIRNVMAAIFRQNDNDGDDDEEEDDHHDDNNSGAQQHEGQDNDDDDDDNMLELEANEAALAEAIRQVLNQRNTNNNNNSNDNTADSDTNNNDDDDDIAPSTSDTA